MYDRWAEEEEEERGTRDLYFAVLGGNGVSSPWLPCVKTGGNKGAGQPGSISRRLLAAAARLPVTCASAAAAAAAAGAAAATAAAAVAVPCPAAPPPHPTLVTAFTAAAPARRFACLGTSCGACRLPRRVGGRSAAASFCLRRVRLSAASADPSSRCRRRRASVIILEGALGPACWDPPCGGWGGGGGGSPGKSGWGPLAFLRAASKFMQFCTECCATTRRVSNGPPARHRQAYRRSAACLSPLPHPCHLDLRPEVLERICQYKCTTPPGIWR